MKKNHFYMPWFGSKRREVEIIFKNLNLKGIKTIIEPYTGSSSISYYISLQKPNCFKYILNDNDFYLQQMFHIMRCDISRIDFENEIEKIIRSESFNKETYFNLKDDIYRWYIHRKIYNIRPSIFPLDNRRYKKKFTLNCPILNFFKTEDITFTNSDGLKCYQEYKNDPQNLLLLDPPYINCNNKNIYLNPSSDIYEFLSNNDIKKEKARIYLILENIYIIKLLFSNCPNKIEYDKEYTCFKKSSRKTTHIIISNIDSIKQ